ncbi:MAG: FAD-binding oxidoreductase [Wenzhouxiangellaceae bacterium]
MIRKLLEKLRDELGSDSVVDGDRVEPRFLDEPRDRWHMRPAGLVRPANTAQVSQVVRLCSAHAVPVVTRGGGTGLVGGASMTSEGREVLLAMDRMHSVRTVDPEAATMTVEAGVALEQARAAAAEHRLDVPLRLASGGNATIGGILATNAGGNTTIRHGNARRMALGLEIVLADGQVLNLLSGLRKDNTGYAITQLMVGSEGTLGIITAATIALMPQPSQRITAWCALRSPAAAINLLRACRERLGETLSAFELMPRRALELVLEYLPVTRDPLDKPHAWYVLMDLDSAIRGDWLEPVTTGVLHQALEAGLVDDVVVSASQADTDALWRLRESISPAQKTAGASIKHDIAVPVAAIPDMIDETLPMLERVVPGIRPCIFGHVGDGNLHFNLSRPADWTDRKFMAKEARLNCIVFDQVMRLGGSFAAEHGIGQLRREQLGRRADPVKLEALRRIKQALDPQNLLNPGKLVSAMEPASPES